MAIYSLSLRASISTINTATWGVQAAAGNESTVYEVRLIALTGSNAVVGLGRSSNVPTLSGGVAVLPEDEARPPGLTQAAVAFGTQPTLPTNFFRRFTQIAANGNGVIWVFTRGIVLAAAGPALVIWNITIGPGTADIDVVVDE